MTSGAEASTIRSISVEDSIHAILSIDAIDTIRIVIVVEGRFLSHIVIAENTAWQTAKFGKFELEVVRVVTAGGIGEEHITAQWRSSAEKSAVL